jgi:hypothetical protein
MKLWKLDRVHSDPYYACARGFVVRAESEEMARLMASGLAGEEGMDCWLTGSSTCVELTADGAPGVVLRDFQED